MFVVVYRVNGRSPPIIQTLMLLESRRLRPGLFQSAACFNAATDFSESIENTSRLVTTFTCRRHVTPTVASLHTWLPEEAHIDCSHSFVYK
jgi:hypothetical protein